MDWSGSGSARIIEEREEGTEGGAGEAAPKRRHGMDLWNHDVAVDISVECQLFSIMFDCQLAHTEALGES